MAPSNRVSALSFPFQVNFGAHGRRQGFRYKPNDHLSRISSSLYEHLWFIDVPYNIDLLSCSWGILDHEGETVWCRGHVPRALNGVAPVSACYPRNLQSDQHSGRIPVTLDYIRTTRANSLFFCCMIRRAAASINISRTAMAFDEARAFSGSYHGRGVIALTGALYCKAKCF